MEKPDAETAQRYLESGEYLWNSGIFAMRPDVWLSELGRFRPDILDACRAAAVNGTEDGAFFRLWALSSRSARRSRSTTP